MGLLKTAFGYNLYHRRPPARDIPGWRRDNLRVSTHVSLCAEPLAVKLVRTVRARARGRHRNIHFEDADRCVKGL